MNTRVEKRELNGHSYYSYIAEYRGVSYEFDPAKRAKNPREVLELSKTGMRRAQTGAVLKYFREKATEEELACPEVIALALKSL
jgi:hypothetical protein